jgi:hypothetical protein
MGTTSHLEPSSEIFIVLRNKNISDFGKLPHKSRFSTEDIGLKIKLNIDIIIYMKYNFDEIIKY